MTELAFKVRSSADLIQHVAKKYLQDEGTLSPYLPMMRRLRLVATLDGSEDSWEAFSSLVKESHFDRCIQTVRRMMGDGGVFDPYRKATVDEIDEYFPERNESSMGAYDHLDLESEDPLVVEYKNLCVSGKLTEASEILNRIGVSSEEKIHLRSIIAIEAFRQADLKLFDECMDQIIEAGSPWNICLDVAVGILGRLPWHGYPY